MAEQTEEQLMLSSIVSSLPTGPEARTTYVENCLHMIELNKAKVAETEEKIRLSLRLGPSFPQGSEEQSHSQRELAGLTKELDGWIAWVKRWETALASVAGDAN